MQRLTVCQDKWKEHSGDRAFNWPDILLKNWLKKAIDIWVSLEIDICC